MSSAAATTDRQGGRAIRRSIALSVALAALLIAGCGSSSSSSSSSSTSTPAVPATTPATSSTPATSPSASSSSSSTTTTTTTSAAAPKGALTLEANREGELKYNKTALSAHAGNVSIAFTNMSPLKHNMTIESSSGKILGATPTFNGGSNTLSLNLKPGTYKFFCSVPGHRMAGMEGTLTVP
jgi:plastocyanin